MNWLMQITCLKNYAMIAEYIWLTPVIWFFADRKSNIETKHTGFVSQDHETMAQVLFSQNLKLNVALISGKRKV